MKLILPLNGKMNKDANPIYLKDGEVLERRNARLTSFGNMHVNVSLKGMKEISISSGEVCGYTEDKKRNWGIFFIKSGKICAYDSDTETVITILSCDFFNFGDVDARVVGDLLVWTDNVNPIRCISIPRALNYTNGTGTWKETYQEVTDLNTRFAIPAPTDNLTATWGYDSLAKSNNLANKTWQFAVQYKYKNDEKSVLSGYSPLYVHPSLVIYPTISDNIKSENYLELDIPLGDSEVVSSTLFARENQGLWFKVKEFKKTNYSDTVVSDFKFYDNFVREYVTVDLSALLNQNVPLKAGRLETAKNRLTLGDITTGYDHPSVSLALSNITKSVQYSLVAKENLSTMVVSTGGYKVVVSANGLTVNNNDTVFLGFGGVADLGIQVDGDNNNFSAKYTFIFNGSYLCTSNSVTAMLDYFVARINDSGDDMIYDIDVYANPTTTANKDCITMTATRSGTSINIVFSTKFGYGLNQYHSVTLSSEYGYSRVLAQAVDSNTFIGGSGYNVGMEYSDDLGNTSGVEAITSITVPYDPVIYDSSITSYKLNRIRAVVSGTPPSWATKYRFVCSKSTSFASVLSFKAGVSYVIEYNGILAIAVGMPKDFVYAFSEGDYVNIKWRVRSGSTLNNETGVEVLGVSPTVTSNGEIKSGNFLIVKTTTHSLLSGTGIVSIYRPKKEAEEYVYFHATGLYDITGGNHSVTTVDLECGDAWMVRSNYNDIVVSTRQNALNPYYIETTYLKNSVSNCNLGKPTVSLQEFKQERLQELWAGGQMIDNTGINELRDFSTSIKVAMSESDGIIQGIKMAGDVMKVIQDNKETSVYIGIEKITNADGTMQLVSSSGYFGTVNRYNTEFGSQHSRSITTNERDLYYFDLDNGVVVRSSPNGQLPISSYGMISYFKEKAEEVNNCILNNSDYNILSYYDRKNGEYSIIFDLPNTKEAVVFNEQNNDWTILDIVSPDICGGLGQYVLLFKNNKLYLSEKATSYNTFLGSNKTMKVVGVVNVSPTQEKCLKSLDLDANEAFDTKITTPITENNVIGQETILKAETYEKQQGKFVSDVFQNIRTTVGNNLDLLYEGDDIQGKFIEIELTKTTDRKLELRDITAAILKE